MHDILRACENDGGDMLRRGMTGCVRATCCVGMTGLRRVCRGVLLYKTHIYERRSFTRALDQFIRSHTKTIFHERRLVYFCIGKS